ncbi:hypothetical protein V1478_003783 [Vespula squamosa]|uniref:Uncharacterized protein n=1 Tax=Vespula squamosa TaxID=30214 RepID=A0ABD2BN56_VESSQ
MIDAICSNGLHVYRMLCSVASNSEFAVNLFLTVVLMKFLEPAVYYTAKHIKFQRIWKNSEIREIQFRNYYNCCPKIFPKFKFYRNFIIKIRLLNFSRHIAYIKIDLEDLISQIISMGVFSSEMSLNET